MPHIVDQADTGPRLTEGRQGRGQRARGTAAPRISTRAWPASLLRTISATAMGVTLTGCSEASDGFLAAAGPVAAAQRDHFYWILGWMTVVVLPLLIGVPFVLWRYRLRRARGDYSPQWNFNRLIEIVIWGVPVVIVAILGFRLWYSAHRLDPSAPLDTGSAGPALTVQVVSMDWKFLFLYPQLGIGTVNRLVVPAGRPVRLRLTSESVMQSFIVPRLAGQIYLMAGMVTELNLEADTPGTYRGQNAQYNGSHFADQKFETKVVAPDAFDAWVARVRSNGNVLDKAGFAKLSRPSVEKPAAYGSIPEGLFGEVVASFRHTATAWQSSARGQ